MTDVMILARYTRYPVMSVKTSQNTDLLRIFIRPTDESLTDAWSFHICRNYWHNLSQGLKIILVPDNVKMLVSGVQMLAAEQQ